LKTAAAVGDTDTPRELKADLLVASAVYQALVGNMDQAQKYLAVATVLGPFDDSYVRSIRKLLPAKKKQESKE